MENLKALELGTISVLEKYNRQHLIEGTRSFGALFYKLQQKYLSYYDRDTQDEIMMDAWSKVFLENGDKNIRLFTGTHPTTGESVHITSYISMLMKNAIINVSKKRTTQVIHEQGVSPIEDEGHEEAYMRTISTPSRVTAHRIDTDYIQYLKEQLQELHQRAQDIAEGRADKRYLGRVNTAIDKLNKKIKEQLGESYFRPVEDWEAIYETDDDQESMFQDLIKRVSKYLTMIDQAVLAGMLGGMSSQEIQVVLDEHDVQNSISRIQDYIINIAEADEFEDNDAYMSEIISELTGKKRRSQQQSINRQDCFRSFKKCVELFCSPTIQDYIGSEIYCNNQDFERVFGIA